MATKAKKSELVRRGAGLGLVPLLFGLAACGGDSGASGEVHEVIFVEGLDVFPYEVVTVGIEQGFFEEEGIEAEVIHTGNEMQALASNSAEFAVGGTLAVLEASSSGIDVFTMFATMEGLGMNTAFSNELVQSTGLTIDDPLEDRVRALEGQTIGLTGPLGDDEVFFRYFLQEAGLDPDSDVTFTYIGGTPDRIAAMDSGRIAAYMSSIPAAELAVDRGVGQRMIVPNEEDLPSLAGIPYTGVHVSRQYAEDNPEIVEGVGRALAASANFMRDEPEATIEIVADAYPELSEDVVRSGMEAIFPAVPESGKMTQEGWDRLRDAGAAAGVVDADHDVSEGVAWTNEYLGDG